MSFQHDETSELISNSRDDQEHLAKNSIHPLDKANSEKIFKIHQDKLLNEKEKLQRTVIPEEKNERVKIIEALYYDKSTLKESDFKNAGQKRYGLTSGYEATDKYYNKFLLKKFFKKAKDCNSTLELVERSDGVNEFVMGGIYRYDMMPNKAPIEQLVIGNNDKLLFVRSKFLPDVIDLYDLQDGINKVQEIKTKALEAGTAIDNEELKQQLKDQNCPQILVENPDFQISQTNGFAKLIASCIIGGEADYHGGNIMYSNKENSWTKIDHGRSFNELYQDFSSFIKATNINFNNLQYNDLIRSASLRFDLSEFNDSLKQTISSLSYERINNMIDQKLGELKKAGFDPEGFILLQRENNEESLWEVREVSPPSEGLDVDRKGIEISCKKRKNKTAEDILNENYNSLATTYKSFLKKSIQNGKVIVNNLEILTKFSKAPDTFDLDAFKTGEWLQKMAEFDCPIKDPVLFAVHHNILIEDKNPLIWAIDNNYPIIKPAMELINNKYVNLNDIDNLEKLELINNPFTKTLYKDNIDILSLYNKEGYESAKHFIKHENALISLNDAKIPFTTIFELGKEIRKELIHYSGKISGLGIDKDMLSVLKRGDISFLAENKVDIKMFNRINLDNEYILSLDTEKRNYLISQNNKLEEGLIASPIIAKFLKEDWNKGEYLLDNYKQLERSSNPTETIDQLIKDYENSKTTKANTPPEESISDIKEVFKQNKSVTNVAVLIAKYELMKSKSNPNQKTTDIRPTGDKVKKLINTYQDKIIEQREAASNSLSKKSVRSV